MSFLAKFLERPWRALAIVLPIAILLALPAVKVRFGGTLLDLLPDRPVARALARAVDAVASEDVDLVMLEASTPESLTRATELLSAELERRPTIASAMARVPITDAPTASALFQALVARADDASLRGLAERFSPAGAENAAQRVLTMAMAPGGGAMRDLLTRDPYDLAPLLGARLQHLGAGVRPNADGAIVSSDGLARLLIVRARSRGRRSAFDMPFADAMLADFNAARAIVAAQVPGVRIRWTGPHSIGPATRDLVRSDLQRSSILASILVSLIFILAMRRVRALIAVGIPLLIGTAWTSALAAVALSGLNAITIAFGAIVLGVGMDTGVHLYDRVLVERRAGHPAHIATERALKALGAPVLTAAVTAGAAFASLCASELTAIRQLGILAAAGEVLTALAIVFLTPVLATLLERGKPPAVAGADRAWPRMMGRLAGAKFTPAFVLVGLVAAVALLTWGPRPRLADSVVLVRPRALEPVVVQEALFARFGGEPGQWIAVGDAPDMEHALVASEALERALAPLQDRGLITGFDTVSALAPSLAGQRARHEAISRMNPAAAADMLAHALEARGARTQLFEPGLSALRAPLPEPRASDPLHGPAAALARRFVAPKDGRVAYLAYIRPSHAHSTAEVRSAVTQELMSVDRSLVLTGYPLLEADVRAALQSDVVRVGGIASALVTLLLFIALRNLRSVGLALAGVAIEIIALMAFLGAARIPLDAYNLLAVPVLVGITIDEIVFVLHAFDEATGSPAERAREAVRAMTSATTATAAATAAGFLALASCKFDALRGLGLVAGVGTLLGLVCAVVVVPALARLTSPTTRG